MLEYTISSSLQTIFSDDIPIISKIIPSNAALVF